MRVVSFGMHFFFVIAFLDVSSNALTKKTCSKLISKYLEFETSEKFWHLYKIYALVITLQLLFTSGLYWCRKISIFLTQYFSQRFRLPIFIFWCMSAFCLTPRNKNGKPGYQKNCHESSENRERKKEPSNNKKWTICFYLFIS